MRSHSPQVAATSVIPDIVMHGLEAPDRLAGVGVQRHYGVIELKGLCDRLLAERGVKTYTSVMSRFLRHLGVTRKKRRSSPASRTGRT
jgi:transposase